MRNIELEIISNILSSDIKPKTLVKNAKIKKLFNIEDIDLEVFINDKTGKEVKKYSQIIYKGNYYKINKPYEDLKQLIINRNIPVLGLAYKSKRYK